MSQERMILAWKSKILNESNTSRTLWNKSPKKNTYMDVESAISRASTVSAASTLASTSPSMEPSTVARSRTNSKPSLLSKPSTSDTKDTDRRPSLDRTQTGSTGKWSELQSQLFPGTDNDTSGYAGCGPAIMDLQKLEQPLAMEPEQPLLIPKILFKRSGINWPNATQATQAANPQTLVDPKSHNVTNVSTFSKYIVVLTIICEICGITAIVLMIVWAEVFLMGLFFSRGYPDSAIDLHALCMITGAIVTVGNAIIVYRVLPFAPAELDKVHKILATLGFIIETIGLGLAFAYHFLLSPPLDHFYSLHSWIGFMSYCLYLFQIIITYLALTCRKACTTVKITHNYHVSFGIWLFALNTIASITGLAQKALLDIRTQKLYPDKKPYNQLTSESLVANFCCVFLVLFVVLVSYLITATNFYQQVTFTFSTTDSKTPMHHIEKCVDTGFGK